jgi:ATP-dependent DNA helicase RecG
MAAFAAGEIQVLVTTTVVEVGVDVPNATLMVVEGADRFGLTQLHQLRGRVGRGKDRSVCVLIPSPGTSPRGIARLEVMTRTSDGFEIAEADLELRGPGELWGTRQSGLPRLKLADLARDEELLRETLSAARAVAAEDRLLLSPEHETLKQALVGRYRDAIELALGA